MLKQECSSKLFNLYDVDDTLNHEIDLNNASITAGYGFYEGTQIGIKRAFELTHDGLPIFQRNFDGSNTDIVDVTNNTIRIPDHFFTTGEPVTYSVGISTNVRIGIETTSFAGIGNTNILPTTLFILLKIMILQLGLHRLHKMQMQQHL